MKDRNISKDEVSSFLKEIKVNELTNINIGDFVFKKDNFDFTLICARKGNKYILITVLDKVKNIKTYDNTKIIEFYGG